MHQIVISSILGLLLMPIMFQFQYESFSLKKSFVMSAPLQLEDWGWVGGGYYNGFSCGILIMGLGLGRGGCIHSNGVLALHRVIG